MGEVNKIMKFMKKKKFLKKCCFSIGENEQNIEIYKKTKFEIPKMVLAGTRFSDILPWVATFNTSESPFNGDSDPSRFELVKKRGFGKRGRPGYPLMFHVS